MDPTAKVYAGVANNNVTVDDIKAAAKLGSFDWEIDRATVESAIVIGGTGTISGNAYVNSSNSVYNNQWLPETYPLEISVVDMGLKFQLGYTEEKTPAVNHPLEELTNLAVDTENQLRYYEKQVGDPDNNDPITLDMEINAIIGPDEYDNTLTGSIDGDPYSYEQTAPTRKTVVNYPMGDKHKVEVLSEVNATAKKTIGGKEEKIQFTEPYYTYIYRASGEAELNAVTLLEKDTTQWNNTLWNGVKLPADLRLSIDENDKLEKGKWVLYLPHYLLRTGKLTFTATSASAYVGWSNSETDVPTSRSRGSCTVTVDNALGDRQKYWVHVWPSDGDETKRRTFPVQVVLVDMDLRTLAVKTSLEDEVSVLANSVAQTGVTVGQKTYQSKAYTNYSITVENNDPSFQTAIQTFIRAIANSIDEDSTYGQEPDVKIYRMNTDGSESELSKNNEGRYTGEDMLAGQSTTYHIVLTANDERLPGVDQEKVKYHYFLTMNKSSGNDSLEFVRVIYDEVLNAQNATKPHNDTVTNKVSASVSATSGPSHDVVEDIDLFTVEAKTAVDGAQVVIRLVTDNMGEPDFTNAANEAKLENAAFPTVNGEKAPYALVEIAVKPTSGSYTKRYLRIERVLKTLTDGMLDGHRAPMDVIEEDPQLGTVHLVFVEDPNATPAVNHELTVWSFTKDNARTTVKQYAPSATVDDTVLSSATASNKDTATWPVGSGEANLVKARIKGYEDQDSTRRYNTEYVRFEAWNDNNNLESVDLTYKVNGKSYTVPAKRGSGASDKTFTAYVPKVPGLEIVDSLLATAEHPYSHVKVEGNADYSVHSQEKTNVELKKENGKVVDGTQVKVDVWSTKDIATGADPAHYTVIINLVELELLSAQVWVNSGESSEVKHTADRNSSTGVYHTRIQPERLKEEAAARPKTNATNPASQTPAEDVRVKYGYLKMPEKPTGLITVFEPPVADNYATEAEFNAAKTEWNAKGQYLMKIYEKLENEYLSKVDSFGTDYAGATWTDWSGNIQDYIDYATGNTNVLPGKTQGLVWTNWHKLDTDGYASVNTVSQDVNGHKVDINDIPKENTVKATNIYMRVGYAPENGDVVTAQLDYRMEVTRQNDSAGKLELWGSTEDRDLTVNDKMVQESESTVGSVITHTYYVGIDKVDGPDTFYLTLRQLGV